MATTDELLAAYASGTTSPGLSLLCAAHLTLNPEGRRFVAAAEEIGGACLADLEPAEPMAADALDAVMARLDDAAPASVCAVAPRAPRAEAAGPLPRPVADALGVAFERTPWRRRIAGIAEHRLEQYEGERVSLLRAPPGARVPHHTHTGYEATLILTGEMRDGESIYRRGDISLNGPDDIHHPEIVGHEICHCLIVADGALRFKGALGAALNLFQKH